jgi:hypothetical protein
MSRNIFTVLKWVRITNDAYSCACSMLAILKSVTWHYAYQRNSKWWNQVLTSEPDYWRLVFGLTLSIQRRYWHHNYFNFLYFLFFLKMDCTRKSPSLHFKKLPAGMKSLFSKNILSGINFDIFSCIEHAKLVISWPKKLSFSSFWMNSYENAVDWSISSYNPFLLMKPTLKENFSFNQMRFYIAKFDTHLKAKLEKVLFVTRTNKKSNWNEKSKSNLVRNSDGE